MDMQKDFIHIDDVFKKAAGGEEQESSGAWSRMKDLLDKEMPAGTALPKTGRSFRRYLPLLLILLMAGGAASYYHFDNTTTIEPTTVGTNLLATNTTPAGAASLATLKDNGVPALTSQPTSVEKGPAYSTTHQNVAKNTAKLPKATGLGTTPSGEPENLRVPAMAIANKSSNQVPSDNATLENVTVNGNQPVVIEQQKVIEQIKPLQKITTPVRSNSAVVSQAKAMQVPAMQPLAVSIDQDPIVQSEAGVYYKEERDTFTQISIARRLEAEVGSNRLTPKIIEDTLAVKRIEKVTYTPLNKMEMIALRQLNIDLNKAVAVVPRARLINSTVTTNEAVSMVPLSKYMVKSKKVDKKNLNSFLQQTTNSLATYFDGSQKFYMAILAGGNMSIGNPAAYGMQLGIAGLYSISERVTLAAELRFLNHYYSNYTIEDSRRTYDVSSSQLPGGSWLFSGKEYTVTSSYRIDHYNSLELPLTANYNLGRLAVYGGVNFSYAFPLKWDRSQSFTEKSIDQQQTTPNSPFVNTGFKLNEQSDFGPRVGIGFVTGVTYDFSRTLSLDVRMRQQVWNNGDKASSLNHLYKSPSLQLSIGYYFGRRDKVVYMMKR